MKVKLVSVDDEAFKLLKIKLYQTIELKKLQSYFPILDDYFNFYNGSSKHFTLRTRNRITDINDNIETKNDDGYIKFLLNCNLKNLNNGLEYKKDVFIKIIPLINVVHYLTQNVNIETSILSNKFNYLSQKKINDPNNSAYIDVFFSHIASMLSESGKCPTFPLFYGTYSGIKENFMFDISEEYDDIIDHSGFKSQLGNKYTIEEINIEKDFTVNEHLLNRECNIDVLYIDDLDIDEVDGNTDSIDRNIEHSEYINELSNKKLDNLIDNITETEVNELISETDLQILSDSETENGSDIYTASPNFDIQRKISYQSQTNFKNLDKLETLSDISACSNHSSDSLKFVNIREFPVQINFIEKLDITLDKYIDHSIGKKISPSEWKSILFQVCFGLAVAQKNLEFTHNDLHSSNIMFKNTQLNNLYFSIHNRYYRIPTFGKITQIIDFGRATFRLNNKIYFSDVFKKNEDAGGQYSYPFNNSLKNCKIKPNKSFDLSRLATTIFHRFENCDDSYDDIVELLRCWTTDKYGNNLMNNGEDFNLYKIIAKNANSANPRKQFSKSIWKEFLVDEKDIPNSEYVYKL